MIEGRHDRSLDIGERRTEIRVSDSPSLDGLGIFDSATRGTSKQPSHVRLLIFIAYIISVDSNNTGVVRD